MLEALEYSHLISFLLKRPHWDNKFDSCPCPPKSPEDLKLNLRSFQRGWVPEVFCFHSVSGEPFSHIRFLGWSLLLPKTLIVIAASRISSPGIFHRNKSQQMYDCTPLHDLFASLGVFPLGWHIVKNNSALEKSLLKMERGLTAMGDD